MSRQDRTDAWMAIVAIAVFFWTLSGFVWISKWEMTMPVDFLVRVCADVVAIVALICVGATIVGTMLLFWRKMLTKKDEEK